jgi:hypothetical protein
MEKCTPFRSKQNSHISIVISNGRSGVKLDLLALKLQIGLLDQSLVIIRIIGGMMMAGNKEVLGEKSCLSAPLPTASPRCIALGFNPDLRGEKPGTNHVSYGTSRGATSCSVLMKSFSFIM